MYGLLIVIHIIAAFALVLVILLQSGKGGGLSGAFGGTSAFGTAFGGRAAPFLVKVTVGLAIIFALTTIGLNFRPSGGGPKATAIKKMQKEAKKASPAAALPTSPEGPADTLKLK